MNAIAPRKPRPFRLTAAVADEDSLHEAVARALTVLVAPPGVASADGTVWLSVEMRNAASAIEGASRRRRGCVAGTPDMFVFHNERVMAIELKTTEGRLSPAQVALHDELTCAGVTVIVCRSVEAVLYALTEFGVTVRGRIAA
jgi:VRR-NUC domain-containing protein